MPLLNKFGGFTVIVVGLLLSELCFAARPYPTRPITDTVVWAAGGGTDTVNRVLMAEMAKSLGVRINVVNKTGGVAGSIGMSSVLSKRPDGYQLVGISSSNVVAGVNGGWRERFDVWHPFIVGSSPDVISVSMSSPYKSLEDLVAAAKQKPKALRVAAGGVGGIHHLYLLEFARASATEFRFIPYPGSAPSQSAAMTGEVDVVITSMAEQAPLLRGKKLRPLAMLHPDDYVLAEDITIKSAFSAYPKLSDRLPLSQAIGFAVNNRAPESVKTKLANAFEEAMSSDSVKQWANDNHYVLSGAHGEQARKEFARLESIFTWALQDLGATQVSPAALGIPKPGLHGG